MSDNEPVTITEFLEARIAEDEAGARAASAGPWFRDSGWSISAPPPEGWDGPYVVVETPRARNDSEFVARHDPARVLAECAAKRWVLNTLRSYEPGAEWHEKQDMGIRENNAAGAVRVMASVYKDHPDYRREWAL